jgi:hypothetical protein
MLQQEKRKTSRNQVRRSDKWLYLASLFIVVWVGSIELIRYCDLSGFVRSFAGVASVIGGVAFAFSLSLWVLTHD